MVAGMVAGFVCKLIEYPLDTVKVQVQTQSANGPQLSPLQMLSKTVRETGAMSLYRGLPSPLVGSMAENSVLFSSYSFAGRCISKDPENQPFGQKLVCGMFSGFCVAKVLTPVELVKCQMQVGRLGWGTGESEGRCTWIKRDMHAYIHTCLHACLHTNIHAYMYTYKQAYIHTYIHTYKDTYIRTSIHTYTHKY